MNVLVTHIHPRPGSSLPHEGEVQHYLKLASKWLPSQTRGFASAEAFVGYLESSKVRPAVVLCDQRGKAVTTEALAAWVTQRRDAGTGSMIFAIGPADGWTDDLRKRADLLLPFGALTLPHALARLVLAEQVYRVATILGGHPYHTGH